MTIRNKGPKLPTCQYLPVTFEGYARTKQAKNLTRPNKPTTSPKLKRKGKRNALRTSKCRFCGRRSALGTLKCKFHGRGSILRTTTCTFRRLRLGASLLQSFFGLGVVLSWAIKKAGGGSGEGASPTTHTKYRQRVSKQQRQQNSDVAGERGKGREGQNKGEKQRGKTKRGTKLGHICS